MTIADGRTITLARRTFVTGLLGAVAAAPLAGPARAQPVGRKRAPSTRTPPSPWPRGSRTCCAA
ncbi:hypothetical protein [Brevundimonas albigilva]|uniref:hypothetical protein n=1 Tax=Brevundimonas albigilva TaxID=1312364 RepID=UPI003D31B988